MKHLIPLAYYEGAGESYAALSMVFGPVMSDVAEYQQQFNCTLNRTPSPPNSATTTASTSTMISNNIHRHIKRGLTSFGDLLHIDNSNTCISPSCGTCQKTSISSSPPPSPSSCHLQTLRVFYASDIKCLCTLLGMSLNGVYFCPYCLASNKDKATGCPHAPVLINKHTSTPSIMSFLPRTREVQSTDYDQFEKNGSNIDHAKKYHNVIAPSIIKTEINGHIAAAPLHCLLGIVKKSIDIITQECIKLDESAKQVDAGAINKVFTDMRETIRAIQETQDSISKLDGCQQQWKQQHLNNVSVSIPADPNAMTSHVQLQRAHQQQQQLLQQHQQHLVQLEQQWQQQKGPFTSALDDVINSIGVHRQAYHGGSFVGNDCIKLLRNAKKISDVLRPRVLTIKPTSTKKTTRRRRSSQASSHPSSPPAPQHIKHVFSSHESSQRAYTLLLKVKQIFDLAYAARPLCKHEQVIFIMRACSFGCWFPRSFPNESITPKMHITIFEMSKLLQRYGTIGMFSEQAIESMHAVFNKLNRQHVSMKCDEKRIEAVVKKSWIFHHPSIQSQ